MKSFQRLVFLSIATVPMLVLADEFPAVPNTEKDLSVPLMPAAEAAQGWTLPPGFQVQLFAAEPEVQNPIAMSWDARGRLWIAENYTYAERAQRFDLNLRDRVLILDDTDGDGRSDKRTVFLDDVQMLTSVLVGHGGVWLMTPPYVLFVPDRNHDDIPDGPAEVVLDGFTVAQENYHNYANGLKWGPDGWLYGRCGASCPGRIGIPGTPDAQRLAMVGTLWRYHPFYKQLEVVCSGTTNPWGHDWNELGECFFINTVNGHLWHAIPGAHFVRPHTLDPQRLAYEQIDMHADHWHFDTGKSWTDSRHGAANDYGGGHAHIGAMVYLGDNWPETYRGRLCTLNMHGRRINQERLEREGGGFVARHEPDLALSPDPWFRGMDLSYGPDGAVYVIDWSDTGECHDQTGVHRESGRVFRISYGEVPTTERRLKVAAQPPREMVLPRGTDLHSLSNEQLVDLQLVQNEWFARQARLVLAERFQTRQSLAGVTAHLKQHFRNWQGPAQGIRLLLTLHAVGATDTDLLRSLLNHHHESLRAWAIRLLTERWPMDDPLGLHQPITAVPPDKVEEFSRRLAIKAHHEDSALVRLTIASTLQRIPVELRPAVAANLARHAEDADDHNLPHMVWYGLMTTPDEKLPALVDVAKESQWPTLTRLIARRLTEASPAHPEPLGRLLQVGTDRPGFEFRTAVVQGMSQAARGWRKATAPPEWEAFATATATLADESLQNQLRELRVVFGDGRALAEVRQIALDGQADVASRMSALETLIDSRPEDLREICEKLLGDNRLNTTAARGLALVDDPQIGKLLVENYRRFKGYDRPQIISLLVSRVSFAKELLGAVQSGKVPREDLSAFQVRQIHSLGNAELSQLVSTAWGELRETPAEKQRQIAQLRIALTAEHDAANLSAGRALFAKSCAACHRLYGEGGKVGPDLTGSNRGNLDYLLENILDPSATVNKDFRMTILQLDDGRVLNGLILEKTDRTTTLRTATEQVTLENGDIEIEKLTNQSPMPEGLLTTFGPDQIRDLFAYLQHPVQVPLLEPADQATGETSSNPTE